MDIETARLNMIENQIRAGGVLSQDILELFIAVKRERFVPEAFRSLAFSDMEIPLSCGENMLTPRAEGLVLDAANVKKQDRVLEIGAGSGHMAALLAQKALSVTTVEIEPELMAFAERNLNESGIFNVDVVLGNGAQGWNESGDVLFDVIVISGSLSSLPDSFLRILAPGGRLVAFIGEDPFIKAQLTRRISHSDFEKRILFETSVKPLRDQVKLPTFRF